MYDINEPAQDEYDIELSRFLRQLADEIDNDQLNADQISNIRDFRYRYISTNIIVANDMEDIAKFMVLGWYIYTIIERGLNAPSNSP